MLVLSWDYSDNSDIICRKGVYGIWPIAHKNSNNGRILSISITISQVIILTLHTGSS